MIIIIPTFVPLFPFICVINIVFPEVGKKKFSQKVFFKVFPKLEKQENVLNLAFILLFSFFKC